MPETTSAQGVPQRITASRREAPTQTTSSYEDKVEMHDIYKVVNYVDKKTWSGTQISLRRWSVMSQAAQDLNDGETRHESREAVHEHEHPHERDWCVQLETTRKLDS